MPSRFLHIASWETDPKYDGGLGPAKPTQPNRHPMGKGEYSLRECIASTRRLWKPQQAPLLPTQLFALLKRPLIPPPSAAMATTATTAIRPTSSAYSTMEAPRSVRARSSRSLWNPRTAKNAFKNSSVISSFPSLAPHVSARLSGPIWSSQCILGFALKQFHRLYGPNTLGFFEVLLLFDGDETHDDSAHQRVSAVRHVEFLKDRRQVVLGRLGADVEPLRDLAVRRTLS